MSRLASLTASSLSLALALTAACGTGQGSSSDLLEIDHGKADDADGASVTPLWMGASGTWAPARVQIERYGDKCATGRDYGDPIVYESWARQRAAEKNICFEVWAPGVTDWDNPDVWKELDVRATYRWNDPLSPAATASEWEWLEHVNWVGDNAQYAFEMTWKDPFYILNSGDCPDVPFVEVQVQSDEWTYATAELFVTFTVNGAVHKPSWDEDGFRVRYQGFVSTSCVTGVP